MVDDYYCRGLRRKFTGFRHASRILDSELSQNQHGEINIERLMTRLHAGMPYDSDLKADQELGLLLTELKTCLLRRLERAKRGRRKAKELNSFAAYCVDNGADCITFNYDDVLDQALWEYKRVFNVEQTSYWHPDGGYGFYCRPSFMTVREADVRKDQTALMLLKLHGSINWYPIRGYEQPYTIDAIIHHETWMPDQEKGPESETIPDHLEPEPFFVPPVLLKSAIVEQPVLRLIWSQAYRVLEGADKVTFVGYSFPTTDIAAGILFQEAMNKIPVSKLKVINYATNETAKKEIRSRYRGAIPGIGNDQFDFRGALLWASGLN